MSQNAHGTFTVTMEPLESSPVEGLTAFSMEKQLQGDLTGSSKGQMISGGDFRQSAAGYVAIESVTGTLHGKIGGFALQQMATMDASGPKIQVVVTPGSGTGELKGIVGIFVIKLENGQHFYDLEYTLPE